MQLWFRIVSALWHFYINTYTLRYRSICISACSRVRIFVVCVCVWLWMSILLKILPQKALPCHVFQLVLAMTKAAVWESVTQLTKGKRTSNFFENQLQFTPTKLAQGPPRLSISIWQTFNHLVKWPIFGQTTVSSGTACQSQSCVSFKPAVSLKGR